MQRLHISMWKEKWDICLEWQLNEGFGRRRLCLVWMFCTSLTRTDRWRPQIPQSRYPV